MNNQTVLYISFEPNTNDFDWLHTLVVKLSQKTTFAFKVVYKEEIDLASPIFAALLSNRLEFLIYDDLRLMRINGEIKQAIQLLKELDAIIESNVKYYLGSFQKNECDPDCQYPRGINTFEIAQFLDNRFGTKVYTSAMASSV
ncbi:hypothetical protein [Xanthocytophaga flava]|uniref:hypothetical protein n=1 Tax=Xanthocytophaga flava TaxID=3048013 RepID=UPI0028D3D1F5|nr:hypothetical protein [Xanthocytophaga flavus]MDJ1470193.1 hypothetical protein [Xanthocytophaga flavus]